MIVVLSIYFQRANTFYSPVYAKIEYCQGGEREFRFEKEGRDC